MDSGVFTQCVSPRTLPVLEQGSHIFTVRATDEAENISNAANHIWVLDLSPPVIEPPQNILTPTTGQLTNVVLVEPLAVDNFDPAPILTNNADVVAPGGFPIGATEVTWTATDAAGNSATATQLVTVFSLAIAVSKVELDEEDGNLEEAEIKGTVQPVLGNTLDFANQNVTIVFAGEEIFIPAGAFEADGGGFKAEDLGAGIDEIRIGEDGQLKIEFEDLSVVTTDDLFLSILVGDDFGIILITSTDNDGNNEDGNNEDGDHDDGNETNQANDIDDGDNDDGDNEDEDNAGHVNSNDDDNDGNGNEDEDNAGHVNSNDDDNDGNGNDDDNDGNGNDEDEDNAGHINSNDDDGDNDGTDNNDEGNSSGDEEDAGTAEGDSDDDEDEGEGEGDDDEDEGEGEGEGDDDDDDNDNGGGNGRN